MSFETTAQETYATLRIYHPDLKPDELTELFQCAPSQSWCMGDELNLGSGKKHKATTGGWLLSSKKAVASGDAKTHLAWLINNLSGLGGAIDRLQKQGYTTDVVIAWFSDSWNTCPAMTPQQMQELANLRLPVWFDVYLNDQELAY